MKKFHTSLSVPLKNIKLLQPKPKRFVAQIRFRSENRRFGSRRGKGRRQCRCWRAIAEHFDKAADPKMLFAAEMGFGQQTVKV
jgi:hypothetical protein